jgi:hypothetical protein
LKKPLNPQIGDFGKILEIWNHTNLDENSIYYSTPHPPLIPYIIAPFVGIFGDNRSVKSCARTSPIISYTPDGSIICIICIGQDLDIVLPGIRFTTGI